MARQSKALTDTFIRQAKPKENAYKLFDGGGLHLVITPTGSKLWRMKYTRPGGKEGFPFEFAYLPVECRKVLIETPHQIQENRRNRIPAPASMLMPETIIDFPWLTYIPTIIRLYCCEQARIEKPAL